VPRFDLTSLLDALRAGGDLDIVRRAVKPLLQSGVESLNGRQALGVTGRAQRTYDPSN
jgi:hypothetical protein